MSFGMFLNNILIKTSPVRLFWMMAGLHLVLWTLVPALASPNAPLDVIEGLAWGREWLIGTYKHPPMQAWWLEILALLTQRAAWARFLASPMAVVIAFWAVWQTGRRLTDDVTALLGVLLLEGIAYYNFTTPEFNPNVLQLPFWALACWSFHRAVKENRWFDWLLLGVWGAGGLYAKYSMLLLLGVLAALLLFEPEARRRLRGPGPPLALAVMLLLLAPHLKWLVAHDFQPFFYAESRTELAVHLYDHVTKPLGFFMAQGLSLLAMIFLLLVLTRGRLRRVNNMPSYATSFDRAFLHAVALGPFVALLAFSALTGIRPRDMWGSHLWNFIGLWLAVHVALRPMTADLRRLVVVWCLVFALGLTAYAGSNWLYPTFKKEGLRVHFPGQALSEAVTEAWQARFQKPLAYKQPPLIYIIGDTWLAGNAAYYAKGFSTASRPHVLQAADYSISPWVTPEDVWAKGGIILWCGDHCRDSLETATLPSYMMIRFPGAEFQKPLVLPQQTWKKIPPAIVGWAILPPASGWRYEAKFYLNKGFPHFYSPAPWGTLFSEIRGYLPDPPGSLAHSIEI